MAAAMAFTDPLNGEGAHLPTVSTLTAEMVCQCTRSNDAAAAEMGEMEYFCRRSKE